MAFYDVAIIGGGPAGLTAAATLARQLHTAVVFDSHNYRNAKATQMHMVPGHEGKDPAEFRRESKEGILSHYSNIEFQDAEVTKVEKKSDSHFIITDGSGKAWNFRKLLLGIGSSNIYPAIEGYEELWAVRIFHCLFCKGYEERGAPSAGVLAVIPIALPTEMLVGLAIHAAENAAQLSERVTLYTHGNEALTAGLNAIIKKEEWTVEPRPIRRLAEGEMSSVTVEFEDGSSNNEKFLVNQPLTVAAGPFVAQLGLATTQLGDIQAEPPFTRPVYVGCSLLEIVSPHTR
ncbi:hypothetical protein VPNG_07477 [Cytospora leucostoma]|uniref:FAD/NAD(P)-binding domain-containing protein n=1 Tax=Cytospora leucostoma TaxID=1230097 RepID=A0A423WS05_9PEZI|nr:hypothetical protein VPNG_07477 [Cytospora leucostoma]